MAIARKHSNSAGKKRMLGNSDGTGKKAQGSAMAARGGRSAIVMAMARNIVDSLEIAMARRRHLAKGMALDKKARGKNKSAAKCQLAPGWQQEQEG